MATTQLLTVADLATAQARMTGCIVNVDSAQSRYHRNSCQHVSAEHFQEKVIEHQGKHGAYYAVDKHREAEALGAVPCKDCGP